MLVMLEMMVQTMGMFVAFNEAALDKQETATEHVSESTQVVGDLKQELSINATTLQPVLEHLRQNFQTKSRNFFNCIRMPLL